MLGTDDAEEALTAIERQEEFCTLREDYWRGIQEIRDVVSAIEGRVNILRRARSETWDLLSETLPSDLGRASTTLNSLSAEIERVIHTRSTSPATTVEQNPSAHEDLPHLESRVEARFQAFTRKVDLLREEFSNSLEGQDKKLREWTRSKLANVTSKERHLRDFAAQVETFVRENCSSPRGCATASEPSYTQGYEGTSVSPRTPQGVGSTAVSSTARPPTYTQVPEPVPLSFSTVLSLFRAMFEQGLFEWRSVTQNNGHLEILLSCKIRKES